MRYVRMPIEVESPEEIGYGTIRYNLSESSVADRTISDLGLTIPDLKLLYNEHRGSERLRSLIVQNDEGVTADDVLIAGGAAGALFIVSTAILGHDDHLVVVRPNYATNLETPRAIGCRQTEIDLSFDDAFSLDPERIAAAITPSTRLVSVTCPHNPTGTTYDLATLDRLVEITRNAGCCLLVDETYRDLSFEPPLPLAATRAPHVISVASLSKAYGVPGIRIGWIIARDPGLKEQFLAAKEQISISGSVIDEWIAEEILSRRSAFLDPVMTEMHRRRDRITEWMASEELLDWVKPSGGVVCFPHMRDEPPGGTDAFYRRLLEQYGCYVGPGHWFERPDRFFRLGFGWPTADELEGGLDAISKALRG